MQSFGVDVSFETDFFRDLRQGRRRRNELDMVSILSLNVTAAAHPS